MFDRRQFTLGLTSTAFAGLALNACAGTGTASLPKRGYGALQPDPSGLLDLPRGFSYRVISEFGGPMDDGFVVPDMADGMGCFALDRYRLALVRNHELKPKHIKAG